MTSIIEYLEMIDGRQREIAESISDLRQVADAALQLAKDNRDRGEAMALRLGKTASTVRHLHTDVKTVVGDVQALRGRVGQVEVRSSSIFEALTSIIRQGGLPDSVWSEHSRKLNELATRFGPQEANAE